MNWCWGVRVCTGRCCCRLTRELQELLLLPRPAGDSVPLHLIMITPPVEVCPNAAEAAVWHWRHGCMWRQPGQALRDCLPEKGC